MHIQSYQMNNCAVLYLKFVENPPLVVLNLKVKSKYILNSFKIIFYEKINRWKVNFLNRYFAIVYPLESVSWLENHTFTIISIIWISGIAIGSPLLYEARAVPLQYGNKSYYDCRELWEEQITSKIYTILLFALMFIIPFLLLAFLYGSIGVKIINRISPGNADTNRDEFQVLMKFKVNNAIDFIIFN